MKSSPKSTSKTRAKTERSKSFEGNFDEASVREEGKKKGESRRMKDQEAKEEQRDKRERRKNTGGKQKSKGIGDARWLWIN